MADAERKTGNSQQEEEELIERNESKLNEYEVFPEEQSDSEEVRSKTPSQHSSPKMETKSIKETVNEINGPNTQDTQDEQAEEEEVDQESDAGPSRPETSKSSPETEHSTKEDLGYNAYSENEEEEESRPQSPEPAGPLRGILKKTHVTEKEREDEPPPVPDKDDVIITQTARSEATDHDGDSDDDELLVVENLHGQDPVELLRKLNPVPLSPTKNTAAGQRSARGSSLLLPRPQTTKATTQGKRESFVATHGGWNSSTKTLPKPAYEPSIFDRKPPELPPKTPFRPKTPSREEQMHHQDFHPKTPAEKNISPTQAKASSRIPQPQFREKFTRNPVPVSSKPHPPVPVPKTPSPVESNKYKRSSGIPVASRASSMTKLPAIAAPQRKTSPSTSKPKPSSPNKTLSKPRTPGKPKDQSSRPAIKQRVPESRPIVPRAMDVRPRPVALPSTRQQPKAPVASSSRRISRVPPINPHVQMQQQQQYRPPLSGGQPPYVDPAYFMYMMNPYMMNPYMALPPISPTTGTFMNPRATPMQSPISPYASAPSPSPLGQQPQLPYFPYPPPQIQQQQQMGMYPYGMPHRSSVSLQGGLPSPQGQHDAFYQQQQQKQK